VLSSPHQEVFAILEHRIDHEFGRFLYRLLALIIAARALSLLVVVFVQGKEKIVLRLVLLMFHFRVSCRQIILNDKLTILFLFIFEGDYLKEAACVFLSYRLQAQNTLAVLVVPATTGTCR